MRLVRNPDPKAIRKINRRKIEKSGLARIDNENIKDFHRRVENMAWDGPVFNRATLDFINELQMLLHDHIMIWLANEFQLGNISKVSDIGNIVDYINAENPPLKNRTYKDIEEESKDWHELFSKNMTNKPNYSTMNVVTETINKNYFWVNVPKEDWSEEGKTMGHCIGAYAKIPGRLFFSLRDKKNNPHTTVEVLNGLIKEIRGKQNKNPIKKYSEMLIDLFSYLVNEGLVKDISHQAIDTVLPEHIVDIFELFKNKSNININIRELYNKLDTTSEDNKKIIISLFNLVYHYCLESGISQIVKFDDLPYMQKLLCDIYTKMVDFGISDKDIQTYFSSKEIETYSELIESGCLVPSSNSEITLKNIPNINNSLNSKLYYGVFLKKLENYRTKEMILNRWATQLKKSVIATNNTTKLDNKMVDLFFYSGYWKDIRNLVDEKKILKLYQKSNYPIDILGEDEDIFNRLIEDKTIFSKVIMHYRPFYDKIAYTDMLKLFRNITPNKVLFIFTKLPYLTKGLKEHEKNNIYDMLAIGIAGDEKNEIAFSVKYLFTDDNFLIKMISNFSSPKALGILFSRYKGDIEDKRLFEKINTDYIIYDFVEYERPYLFFKLNRFFERKTMNNKWLSSEPYSKIYLGWEKYNKNKAMLIRDEKFMNILSEFLTDFPKGGHSSTLKAKTQIKINEIVKKTNSIMTIIGYFSHINSMNIENMLMANHGENQIKNELLIYKNILKDKYKFMDRF